MSVAKIIQLHGGQYVACAVVQTYEPFCVVQKKLEKNIIKSKIRGKVLVDTLFHKGNSSDRFLELDVSDDTVNWQSIKVAKIDKRDNLRKVIANNLKNDFELLDNSILTDVQKSLIKHGIGI